MVLGTSQYKAGIRATLFGFDEKGAAVLRRRGDAPADRPATVVGASKIELTFNKEIVASNAVVSLKGNNQDTVISNTYGSVDNKKLTVVTANKIVQGQYNITVSGLTQTPITASINAENEKVANVQYLNNKAYIDENDNKKLHVYYTIYNQYNEDVTSSVYASEGLTFATPYEYFINGVNEIIIKKPGYIGLEGFKLRELLPISILYQPNDQTYYTKTILLTMVYKEASVDFIPELPETIIKNIFDTTGKSVIAKLRIYNKYYDDVTELYKNDPNVIISTNRGVASPVGEDGKFTITSDKVFNNYDTVQISVYHKTLTGINVKDAYVRDGYKVNEINFKSIYNKDNLDLNTDNLATADFYLVLDVKDEYGRTVTDDTYLNGDLISSSSNTSIIDIDNGIKNMDIAGKTEAVIHIKKSNNYFGGNATVEIQSKTSGAIGGYPVFVKGKRPADLKIKGLYNKDNLTLNTDNLATADFYLVLDIKDDYGKSLIDTTSLNNDLICTSSNGSVIYFDNVIENILIDGKTEAVIHVIRSNNYVSGDAVITIVSKTTGKMAQFFVNVIEAPKVDSLTIEAPSEAYVGEETIIPYKAIDQYGNEVTNINKLSKIIFGIGSLGTNVADIFFKQNQSNGKVELVLDLKNSSYIGKLSIVAITITYKTESFTIDIKRR